MCDNTKNLRQFFFVSHSCTYLSEEISKSPSNKRSESFCRQRMLVKRLVVRSPAWNCASAGDGRITKEGTGRGLTLAEWRRTNGSSLLHNRARRIDSESASRNAKQREEDRRELHGLHRQGAGRENVHKQGVPLFDGMASRSDHVLEPRKNLRRSDVFLKWCREKIGKMLQVLLALCGRLVRPGFTGASLSFLFSFSFLHLSSISFPLFLFLFLSCSSGPCVRRSGNLAYFTSK